MNSSLNVLYASVQYCSLMLDCLTDNSYIPGVSEQINVFIIKKKNNKNTKKQTNKQKHTKNPKQNTQKNPPKNYKLTQKKATFKTPAGLGFVLCQNWDALGPGRILGLFVLGLSVETRTFILLPPSSQRRVAGSALWWQPAQRGDEQRADVTHNIWSSWGKTQLHRRGRQASEMKGKTANIS